MRYVSMCAIEAATLNVVNEFGEPVDADYYVRVLVDTERGVAVYEESEDVDAPEDMYLDRRLNTFTRELNRLAEEVVRAK